MILALKMHSTDIFFRKSKPFSLELKNEVLRSGKIRNWWLYDLQQFFKELKDDAVEPQNMLLSTRK